jgi:hypothetical protein
MGQGWNGQMLKPKSKHSNSTAQLASIQWNEQTGLPDDVLENFQVASYRHASTILRHDFPDHYHEIVNVLSSFSIPYTQIIVGGGGKGPIAIGFDAQLKKSGWREKQIPVEMTIDGVTYKSPGHKIDLFKDRIAVEMEWNNKTEFYDRDLDNFRKLHSLGAISLGIIVTRATGLKDVFLRIDQQVADCNFQYRDKSGALRSVKKVSSKYGQSTTHADKLFPKIDGGGGGQCPILVLAISPGPRVGIDDYSEIVARVRAVGRTTVLDSDMPSRDLQQLAIEREHTEEEN